MQQKGGRTGRISLTSVDICQPNKEKGKSKKKKKKSKKLETYRGSSPSDVGHGVSSYALFLYVFSVAAGMLKVGCSFDRPKWSVRSEVGASNQLKGTSLSARQRAASPRTDHTRSKPFLKGGHEKTPLRAPARARQRSQSPFYSPAPEPSCGLTGCRLWRRKARGGRW